MVGTIVVGRDGTVKQRTFAEAAKLAYCVFLLDEKKESSFI